MEHVDKPTYVATPDLIPCFPRPGDEWYGKSSTRGRRQIQNRLNQRAFRLRQRTRNNAKALGEINSNISVRNPNRKEAKDAKGVNTPPFLSCRTKSAPERTALGSKTPLFGVFEILAAKPADVDHPQFLSGRTKSAPASGKPGSNTSPSTLSTISEGRTRDADKPHFLSSPEKSKQPQAGPGSDTRSFRLLSDELSLLIQQNVMEGARLNAQHLGIDPDNLLEGGHGGVLSRQGHTIPRSLMPGKLQGEVQHDPIIDILPYPRLRHQLVQALAAGELDEESFCAEVRESGALDTEGYRYGLLCWGCPDDVGAWEMSEQFARRWCFVLQGCERLLESTNLWRLRRSETAIGLIP